MEYLTTETIIWLHEEVINVNELQGIATHKSIDAIVDRVINRINYGLINDVFDLAACYAVYIAVGYAFNDANKRTAFASMNTVLAINDIYLSYETEEAGNMIINAVLGNIDEQDISKWLRKKYNNAEINTKIINNT